MKVQDVYQWEAQMEDGSLVTAASPPELRGDLSRCVRFSLIPADGVPHPRHDLTGVAMVRRFCRGFHKTRFNRRRELPGKLFWQDGAVAMASSEDWREILSPGDWIGKGVAGEAWYVVREVLVDGVVIETPYAGKSKPNGMFCRYIHNPVNQPTFVYLHCVECDGFRIWFDYATGAAKTTPQKYEEYL